MLVILIKCYKTQIEISLKNTCCNFIGPWILTFPTPLLKQKLTQNSLFFSSSLPTNKEERKKESSSIFASISCQILKSNRLIHKFFHKTCLLGVFEVFGGFCLKREAPIYLVSNICKVSKLGNAYFLVVRWNLLVIEVKDAILWAILRFMVELWKFSIYWGIFCFIW